MLAKSRTNLVPRVTKGPGDEVGVEPFEKHTLTFTAFFKREELSMKIYEGLSKCWMNLEM